MSNGLLGWLHAPRRAASEEQTVALIGLGNPGPRHAGDRHNAGFMCIDLLASRLGAALGDKRRAALLGEGRAHGKRIVLVQPRTFMNRSGEAVRYVLDRFRIGPAAILVILDDLDLPVGRIRLRAGGGAGGHNGLHSINHSLGADAYPRLRIGIGRPQGDAVEHVLTGFTREEAPVFEQTLQRAADAAEDWVRHGIQHAMNHFN